MSEPYSIRGTIQAANITGIVAGTDYGRILALENGALQMKGMVPYGSDINYITDIGFYYISDNINANYSNTPWTSNTVGYLVVYRNTNACMQVAYSASNMYVRRCNNVTADPQVWYPSTGWTSFATTNDVDSINDELANVYSDIEANESSINRVDNIVKNYVQYDIFPDFGDYPWGTGERTHNGVTYRWSADRSSITASGTATATSYNYIYNATGATLYPDRVKKGGRYWFDVHTTNNHLLLEVYCSVGGTTFEYTHRIIAPRCYVDIPSDAVGLRIRVRVDNGFTVDNDTISFHMYEAEPMDLCKYKLVKIDNYTFSRGVFSSDGEYTFSTGSRCTELNLEGVSRFFYKPSNYSGDYGYAFFSDEQFVKGYKTMTGVQHWIEVPEGVNRVKLCWQDSVTDQEIWVEKRIEDIENVTGKTYNLVDLLNYESWKLSNSPTIRMIDSKIRLESTKDNTAALAYVLISCEGMKQIMVSVGDIEGDSEPKIRYGYRKEAESITTFVRYISDPNKVTIIDIDPEWKEFALALYVGTASLVKVGSYAIWDKLCITEVKAPDAYIPNGGETAVDYAARRAIAQLYAMLVPSSTSLEVNE